MMLEEKYLSRKILTYSALGEVGKYLVICPKDVPPLVDWFLSGPRSYRDPDHESWKRRLIDGELFSEFYHPRGTGFIRLVVFGTYWHKKVTGEME